MSLIYETLAGDKINLEITNLTEEQVEYLRECFKLFLANTPWGNFTDVACGQDALRVCGARFYKDRYWPETPVKNSPLYKILRNLNAIIGFEQGIYRIGIRRRPENHDEVLKTFLGV